MIDQADWALVPQSNWLENRWVPPIEYNLGNIFNGKVGLKDGAKVSMTTCAVKCTKK